MSQKNTPFTHRQPRTWRKVVFQAPNAFADWAASALFTITGNGVQTEPGETPDTQTLIGYINTDSNEKRTEGKINDLLTHLSSSSVESKESHLNASNIEEEDWGALWKEKFKPVYISEGLVVCPSWDLIAPTTELTVVAIDPGMAFGTGLHATTQLALQITESCFQDQQPPSTVLDIGTGTGIIAITSALFGAEKVVATDIDPDAVHAAQENINRNNTSQTVRVGCHNLSDIVDSFDLVIANITHDVLLEMATDLARLTKDSGRLILTGLLAGRQTDSIITALKKLGFPEPDIFPKDEWTALLFRRK